MITIADITLELTNKLLVLTARANEIEENLSEEPDSDWSDNAIESESDEVLEGVGSITLRDIQQIKRALSKIKAGTYEVCERCGGPISMNRLEAHHYATCCIACA